MSRRGRKTNGEAARLSPFPVCMKNSIQKVQPPEGDRNFTQDKRKEDRNDWMIDRKEFLKFEKEFGPHTLDGCCDE